MSIQFKRGSSKNRLNSVEVLKPGQPFFEKDTKKVYIGDGNTELKNLVASSDYDEAIKNLEAVDIATKQSLEDLKVQYEAKVSTLEAADTTNSDAIGEINKKIPGEASETNQLADKQYVISHIQSSAGSFQGTWENWANVPSTLNNTPTYPSTPKANDYLIVSSASDYVGDKTLSGTWRFKYTGEWSTNGKDGWKPEYQISNDAVLKSDQAEKTEDMTQSVGIDASGKLWVKPSDFSASIDQTYSAESEKAQSGKAVAEAINDALGLIETQLADLDTGSGV